MNRFLVALPPLCLAMMPMASWAIDELAARKISEDAAGCAAVKPCETRARFENGQWVLNVSTIYGYRENGEPFFKPGGWVGFTINNNGKIVHRMPGR